MTVIKGFNIVKGIHIVPTIFCPEYRAVLDRAGTLGHDVPPTLRAKLVDDVHIREAIDLGIWSVSPLMYEFHTTGSSGYARINLKNPSQFFATLHGSTLPAYDLKSGFKGNSTEGAHIRTGWRSDLHNQGMVSFNEFGVGWWIGQAISAGEPPQFQWGATSGVGGRLRIANTTYRIFTGSDVNAGVSMTGTGFRSVERTNSITQRATADGVIVHSSDEVPSLGAFITTQIYILCQNDGNLPGSNNPLHFHNNRIDSFLIYNPNAVSHATINTWQVNHRARVSNL